MTGQTRTVYDRTLGYLRVSLSDAEVMELEDRLRKLHIRIMADCVRDAREVVLEKFGPAAPSTILIVARTFFERRAPAMYTAQQDALNRKADALRNGTHDEGEAA